ncbi:hypothetical protein [Azospirillum doebereinerae]
MNRLCGRPLIWLLMKANGGPIAESSNIKDLMNWRGRESARQAGL